MIQEYKGFFEIQQVVFETNFTFCCKLVASLLVGSSHPLPKHTTTINTNMVLSDSGAPLKFEFCMLKNITHADF